MKYTLFWPRFDPLMSPGYPKLGEFLKYAKNRYHHSISDGFWHKYYIFQLLEFILSEKVSFDPVLTPGGPKRAQKSKLTIIQKTAVNI